MIDYDVAPVDAGDVFMRNHLPFPSMSGEAPVEAHVCPYDCPEIGKSAVDKKLECSYSVEHEPGEEYRCKPLWWQIFIQHGNIVPHVEVGLKRGLLGQGAASYMKDL